MKSINELLTRYGRIAHRMEDKVSNLGEALIAGLAMYFGGIPPHDTNVVSATVRTAASGPDVGNLLYRIVQGAAEQIVFEVQNLPRTTVQTGALLWGGVPPTDSERAIDYLVAAYESLVPR